MLELIISRKEKKEIALVENGKLLEIYEDNGDSNRNEGNIYIGVVKDILKGMQSAFVDIGTEKNSFIHFKDILPKVDEVKEKQKETIDIKDVIKVNDKILVQIRKDSNDKKGARVTTHISLSSRYIVLMPNTDIITISQKIEDDVEKQRLIQIVEKKLPKNIGAIIRTSAKSRSEIELVKDLNYLLKKWEDIIKKQTENISKAPQLIYKSPNVEERIIIDVLDKGLEKIIVNDKIDYENIKKLQEENQEYEKINLILKESEDILDVYDLDKQIKKSQDRKIWLNCGGFITIDKTEALTAIDVNTGKYTGHNNVEDTIYKVNQEATVEIAKQLRLRDIGGIIIIDYIDMKNEKNKERIENTLKELLKQDRAKTQVEGFTKLELMELTRKHICSHNND